MPCYIGRAIKCLIKWAVATRRKYPNKRILATKLDIKLACRQCHLNTTTAIQTCTQLPTIGLALMMLQLTFGGAPCPAEWGSIAESICDLAYEILLRDKWEPLSLFFPAQLLVPEKTHLTDNILVKIGRELVVNIPVDLRGKIDIYIDDFVSLTVDIDGSDNAKRMESAPILAVGVMSREVSELKPLPHDDMEARNNRRNWTHQTKDHPWMVLQFPQNDNIPSRKQIQNLLKSNVRNHPPWLDIKRRTGDQHWEMGPPWTNRPASTPLPQQIVLPKTESREQAHDNG
jgi:hypothetical protein